MSKKFLGISVVVVLLLSILVSQEALAVGLKVYVTLTHSSTGSTELCVKSSNQQLGCKTINLSGLASPLTSGPWTFGDNVIPVGGQFQACLNSGSGPLKCVSGTNGVAKSPEYVSLTVPSGTTSSVKTDYRAACNLVADALYYPCSEYLTNDGSLTREGKRAFDCIKNGFILGVGGLAITEFNLPFVIAALGLLAGFTDCENVVHLDKLSGALGTVNEVLTLKSSLGI